MELTEVAVDDPFEQVGLLQEVNFSPVEGCGEWKISWVFNIPEDMISGIYAAKCEDTNNSVFYVTFIINPPSVKREQLMLIANTTTWNAYNGWGGYSSYEVPGNGEWKFSYLRPNHYILNPSFTSSAIIIAVYIKSELNFGC
jgi:hypothetical protein